MKRRIGVTAGWVLATVVSVLLASAAVATVQNEVTERPSPLHSAALDQLASSSTTTTQAAAVEPTTTQPPASTAAAPSSTIGPTTTDVAATEQGSSTTVPSPVTSTTEGSSPTTSTTSPPTTSSTTSTTVTTTTSTTIPTTSTSTTSTTVPESGDLQSYDAEGGSILIEVFTSTVVLVSVTPTTGYSVDIEAAGPPNVEVEFHEIDGTHKSTIKAKFEAGKLDVDIKEKEGDGKD